MPSCAPRRRLFASGYCSAPIVNEVAVVIVNQEWDKRDITIHAMENYG